MKIQLQSRIAKSLAWLTAALVLASLLGPGMTAAQGAEPGSEGGMAAPARAQADSQADRPDNPGATSPTNSEGDLSILQLPGGPQSPPGSLADQQPTAYSYFTVAGATFRPRGSASGWAYDGSGCLHRTSGSDLFNTELHLNDGVTLNYLRIYYYDADATYNQTAWITRYQPSVPSTVDLVSVLSTGSSGNGTALSAAISSVVDNVNYAYVLNWNPGANTSNLRLCGLRVAYTP